MIKLALKDNDWVRLCERETIQPEWTPTLESLRFHLNELKKVYGQYVQLKLLCGADLVESFNVQGLWREDHIKEIVSEYGLAIINRVGSNPEKFIYDKDILYANKV
jgi:nicotinamide mononucleotide adenylyltransferase